MDRLVLHKVGEDDGNVFGDDVLSAKVVGEKAGHIEKIGEIRLLEVISKITNFIDRKKVIRVLENVIKSYTLLMADAIVLRLKILKAGIPVVFT